MMITLHVYLPNFTYVVTNFLISVYVKIFINKVDETMRFRTFVINSYLAWMPAGVQMNLGGSSVHVQWFSHLNGGADICDIIK